METIDLRENPRGCSEHPLVRLKKIVEKLEPGGEVKVVTDPKIIPIDAIKVIAEKNELELTILVHRDDVCEALLKKK